MSDTNVQATSGGTGFLGLLTLLFIGLKLTGYIAWSWLWVLSPLWFGAATIILACILIFLGAMLVAIIKAIVDSIPKKRKKFVPAPRSSYRYPVEGPKK